MNYYLNRAARDAALQPLLVHRAETGEVPGWLVNRVGNHIARSPHQVRRMLAAAIHDLAMTSDSTIDPARNDP